MKHQTKRMSSSKRLKRKPLSVSRGHQKESRLGAKRPPYVAPIVEDPRVKLAREQYETAVGFLTRHKYERAVPLFEKVLGGPSAELVERARTHLSICRQHMERRAPALRTAEDHYNYAVAQINSGQLGDAEEHLNRAMKQMPRADHLHYALAAVRARQGQVNAALGSLKTAIDLDQRNRYLARNDGDFAALCEDPRFADLIYPEKGSYGSL